MEWTKDTPTKNGLYWFRPLLEEPRLVRVEVADDHIWDTVPHECMRSLRTFMKPKYNTLWAGPVEDAGEAHPGLPAETPPNRPADTTTPEAGRRMAKTKAHG